MSFAPWCEKLPIVLKLFSFVLSSIHVPFNSRNIALTMFMHSEYNCRYVCIFRLVIYQYHFSFLPIATNMHSVVGLLYCKHVRQFREQESSSCKPIILALSNAMCHGLRHLNNSKHAIHVDDADVWCYGNISGHVDKPFTDLHAALYFPLSWREGWMSHFPFNINHSFTMQGTQDLA